MPLPESKQAKSSRTLFDGELPGADDVLHSVATVEVFWAQEKARRRRLMLKYGLPSVVVLLALALLGAWHFKVYPFDEKPAWLTAPEPPAEGEPGALVERAEGNPEAKVKIVVVKPAGGELDANVSKILHEAIDLKPSEFYLEYQIADKLPKEERELLMEYQGQLITVNGKSDFSFGDPKRPDHTVSLKGFAPMFYTPQDLLEVINQVYREEYGPTDAPLLDLEALGLAPADGHTAGSGQEPLPKVVTQDGEQGDIKLRLPEINVEE